MVRVAKVLPPVRPHTSKAVIQRIKRKADWLKAHLGPVDYPRDLATVEVCENVHLVEVAMREDHGMFTCAVHREDSLDLSDVWDEARGKGIGR